MSEIRFKNFRNKLKKNRSSNLDKVGQERYKSITSAYFTIAKGVFVLYDINKKNSFQSIDKQIKDLKMNSDENIIIILTGN